MRGEGADTSSTLVGEIREGFLEEVMPDPKEVQALQTGMGCTCKDPEAGRNTPSLSLLFAMPRPPLSPPHPDIPPLPDLPCPRPSSPGGSPKTEERKVKWESSPTALRKGETAPKGREKEKKNHHINSIVSTPGSCLKNNSKIKPQLGRLYLAKHSTRRVNGEATWAPRGGERRPGLSRRAPLPASTVTGRCGCWCSSLSFHLVPRQPEEAGPSSPSQS